MNRSKFMVKEVILTAYVFLGDKSITSCHLWNYVMVIAQDPELDWISVIVIHYPLCYAT